MHPIGITGFRSRNLHMVKGRSSGSKWNFCCSRSRCEETRLVAGRPDVNALSVFVFRIEFVIVDDAVLDGVTENLCIDDVVLQSNAFTAVGIVNTHRDTTMNGEL